MFVVRRVAWLSVALSLTVYACGEGDSPPAPAVDTVARLSDPTTTLAPGGGTCDVGALTEGDRLDAMLVVQTVVLTWDPDIAHAGALVPPAPVEVARALDVIRCDVGTRAVSRHGRAIAKLLGYDWGLERAGPLLLRLGFSNPAAIENFRERVAADYSESAFLLQMHDPGWLEFAALRRLTMAESPPGRMAAGPATWPIGPSFAYAQTPFCWQPESPSTYSYVRPYVELTAYVSVNVGQNQVQANVDPQQWNDCGRFWGPPDPNNPGGVLDGAWFVQPQWSPGGPCTTPQEPFTRQSPLPSPGTPYPEHYLFEHFFLTGGSDRKPWVAWFKNILGILATSTSQKTKSGTTVPAHRIDYWLGLCGTDDDVDGAMGGEIATKPLKTILDSGDVQVWTEDGRTHVKASKVFEFDDSTATWLTQLNPALRELNEQLGEMACCL